MIAPINTMTMGGGPSAFQTGVQLGAGNNPLTPLGQAIMGVKTKFDTIRAAQMEQNNAMELQGSKNKTDIEVANIGAGVAGGGMTEEQEAQIAGAYEKPAFVRDESGAVVVRNLDYDPKLRQLLPKWTPIASPDAVKQEKAAIYRTFNEQQKAKQGGKAASAVNTPFPPFTGAQQSAPLAPEDEALVAKIEAMAQKFKQSQVPTTR
jgi:hypothetical protein